MKNRIGTSNFATIMPIDLIIKLCLDLNLKDFIKMGEVNKRLLSIVRSEVAIKRYCLHHGISLFFPITKEYNPSDLLEGQYYFRQMEKAQGEKNLIEKELNVIYKEQPILKTYHLVEESPTLRPSLSLTDNQQTQLDRVTDLQKKIKQKNETIHSFLTLAASKGDFLAKLKKEEESVFIIDKYQIAKQEKAFRLAETNIIGLRKHFGEVVNVFLVRFYCKTIEFLLKNQQALQTMHHHSVVNMGFTPLMLEKLGIPMVNNKDLSLEKKGVPMIMDKVNTILLTLSSVKLEHYTLQTAIQFLFKNESCQTLNDVVEVLQKTVTQITSSTKLDSLKA